MRLATEAIDVLTGSKQPMLFHPPRSLSLAATVATLSASAVAASVLDQGHGSQSQRVRREAEKSAQAYLVRDIFNPFQQFSMAPFSSTVEALARAVHKDRDFTMLPILADALEDAGCTNFDILNHCRQPGAHFLGCWVVDLLLGKQ